MLKCTLMGFFRSYTFKPQTCLVNHSVYFILFLPLLRPPSMVCYMAYWTLCYSICLCDKIPEEQFLGSDAKCVVFFLFFCSGRRLSSYLQAQSVLRSSHAPRASHVLYPFLQELLWVLPSDCLKMEELRADQHPTSFVVFFPHCPIRWIERYRSVSVLHSKITQLG